jgi:hypothetical protein
MDDWFARQSKTKTDKGRFLRFYVINFVLGLVVLAIMWVLLGQPRLW